MVEALKAAVLGFVQGLTEFFPISSSAHLRVLRSALGFEVEGLAFDIAVHLATLIAVVIYFRREILDIARGDRRFAVLGRLALASLPLFLAGFVFGHLRETLSLWVIAGCWTFSGTYLLLMRGRGGRESYDRLSFSGTLAVGMAQALAYFPGMSRSGTTIAAGLLFGMSRQSAATFSFLLAIPAIAGAAVYQCLKLREGGGTLDGLVPALTVAMPVSFAVGMAAIHLLLRVVRGDGFYRFGWYNLGAALLFSVYLVW